jgi:hypothetical protein
MTDDRAPRRDGIKCPEWCETDHADSLFGNSCTGRPPGGGPNLNAIWASPALGPGGRPRVSVTGYSAGLGYTGHASSDARDGDDLAGVIELLAELTPEQHRQLAESVRASAALAREADAR